MELPGWTAPGALQRIISRPGPAMMDLGGKVALVTGGGRGIGKAAVSALVAKGCKVALVDRVAEVGEAAAAEIGGSCHFFQCSVDDPQQLEATFAAVEAALGPLDIVYCNAGAGSPGDDGLANWQRLLAVNLGHCIQGSQLARDSFRASGKPGVIIHTASIVGLIAERERGHTVYAATKWGIVGFTRSLQRWRTEEPPIRMAAVCPALVLTEGVQAALDSGHLDLPEYDKGVPPSDIADAVLRMIAGDLSEEAVVAVGPTGAHGDPSYAEQSRTYGADGILFGNAPKL